MPKIISARDIGKKYLIHHNNVDLNEPIYNTPKKNQRSFGEKILNAFKKKHSQYCEEFWALRNINFDIDQGERIGILGSNGAGKSTLLKILSQITEPTTGHVKINGNVASLLEVGTGFHPELTGRENIFLNGAILGMKKIDITKNFDAIVDFSGIEKFLDTPVKHYSSGMYIRLAFAVASHLNNDILIVDEVLAVGDMSFQNKCLDRMRDITLEGRTVIFVTHNMKTIADFTERSILLENGQCKFIGRTSDAITEYMEPFIKPPISEPLPLPQPLENGHVYTCAPHTNKPTLVKIEIITSQKNGIHQQGAPLDVCLYIHAPLPLECASIAIQFVDKNDKSIVYLWRLDSEKPLCRTTGMHFIKCHIPKLRLYQGRYTLTVYFSEKHGVKNNIMLKDICPFEVVMCDIRHDFVWHTAEHRFTGWQPEACTYLESADWTEICVD